MNKNLNNIFIIFIIVLLIGCVVSLVEGGSYDYINNCTNVFTLNGHNFYECSIHGEKINYFNGRILSTNVIKVGDV